MKKLISILLLSGVVSVLLFSCGNSKPESSAAVSHSASVSNSSYQAETSSIIPETNTTKTSPLDIDDFFTFFETTQFPYLISSPVPNSADFKISKSALIPYLVASAIDYRSDSVDIPKVYDENGEVIGYQYDLFLQASKQLFGYDYDYEEAGADIRNGNIYLMGGFGFELVEYKTVRDTAIVANNSITFDVEGTIGMEGDGESIKHFILTYTFQYNPENNICPYQLMDIETTELPEA